MPPPKLLSARASTRSPLQQASMSQFLSANNPDQTKFSGPAPAKKKKKSSGISLALKGSF